MRSIRRNLGKNKRRLQPLSLRPQTSPLTLHAAFFVEGVKRHAASLTDASHAKFI